jgi:hypothetical protein
MTEVAVNPEKTFYNWGASEATKYSFSLWYTGPKVEETLRVRIWTIYYGETTEMELLDRNYVVQNDIPITINSNEFFPHKRQSSSWDQLNPSRWLSIYIEATELGTSQTFEFERPIYIDYNWTPARQQETQITCGTACVQMMVYHIRNTVYSQSSIGYSDSMWQYREKANYRISGISSIGNPYAELLRESQSYSFSNYINEVLSQDMRATDYHTQRRSGHLNAPIVKPAVLPYYPSSATTGHYVLVIGYDLQGNAYLLDPHYNDSYFGFHKVDGNILLDANRAHSYPGWFLQSNIVE